MPTAGVPDDVQWNGVYSATIAVTQDPLNQGRVRLFIPQVLGTAQSNWASAMQPGITPAAGTQVLAIFLGGNINLPYYFVGISTSLIEAVSSGSTVLNSNPFFTGNLLTGWDGVNGSLLALQPNADTNPPFPNAAFLSLSGTGGGYIQEDAAPFTAVVGNYYQVQAWVYYPLGGGVNIGAFFPSAGDLVEETTVPPGEWTNISFTVQATDTTGYPMVGPAESNPNDQFYAAAVCVIGQPNAADIGGIINGYNAFGTVIGGSAFLLYNGIPGAGNLIGSWAPNSGGVDAFGNSYPIGFNAVQGTITGMSITNAQIMQSTLSNCSSIGETISNPNITGGLMTETSITFDSTGGGLICYTTTTATVSENSNGSYQWTCPAGVTTASIQAWGAGGGGSGCGTNTGGPSGGGGEYAAEFSYAVTAGQVYDYVVGNGGGGGTGGAGGGGTDTSFDLAGPGVYANGGDADEGSGTGGLGGTGSTNSLHRNGGNGQTPTSGDTGGCSGGNSGGYAAAGNNGIKATGSTGAASPAAQSPNGHGGAGGSAGANGSSGGSPGAGGGGAGYVSGVTNFSKTYNATESKSYYGADASNGDANGVRATNSTIWQGGETATGGSANGTQKSAWIFDYSEIQSDLANVTMSQINVTIYNQHWWYGAGGTVQLRGWQPSQGTSLPSSWNGLGSPELTQFNMDEGVKITVSLYSNTGAPAAFQDGGFIGFAMGPGPSAYNLQYYGYFNGTGSGSEALQMTAIGTTGGSPTTAGSGADGQVYITYTTGYTVIASIQPVATTDPNTSLALPAGVAGTQVTLFGTATPAPSAANNAVMYSSTLGTPAVILPSGLTGYVPVTQIQVATFTNANNGTAVTSNTYTIQAGDANNGTIYELWVPLAGTNGSSTVEAIGFKPYLNSGVVTTSNGDTVGATGMQLIGGSPGLSEGWTCKVHIRLIVISSSLCNIYTEGFLCNIGNIQGGASASSFSLTSQATGVAFTAANNNTLALATVWGAAAAGQTVSSGLSTFTRSGS